METYLRGEDVVLADNNNKFVYYSCICIWHKGYYSIINSEYFSSDKEIKGIVESFFKNPYIQYTTELHSAPKQWLEENNFVLYTKKKISKNKPKNKKTNDK